MNILHSIVSISNSIIPFFLAFLGVGFLIGFHELGHFLFCKLLKIRTPSFSIGMGPRIFSKQIGETNFVLSAIPMGGYVEIAGSSELGQGDQLEAKCTDKNSFANRPYYQKMMVMAGGILFNLLFAYLALVGLLYYGMPSQSPFLDPNLVSTEIGSITPNSPAEAALLKKGDVIVSIDNNQITNGKQLIEEISKKPNQNASFIIKRNNSNQEITVPIGAKTINNAQLGYLGVGLSVPPHSFASALKLGFHATYYLVSQVALALKSIVVHRKMDNLGGPIMVIAQTIKGAEQGFTVFLLLLAFISANLALINLIPLPIFDGGQALFYTIEAIINRPLSEKIREYIHYITWILLLILLVYLSVKDIFRIFVK